MDEIITYEIRLKLTDDQLSEAIHHYNELVADAQDDQRAETHARAIRLLCAPEERYDVMRTCNKCTFVWGQVAGSDPVI